MHKSIKKSARIFSLILVLALLVGIVPANAAGDIQFRQTDATAKTAQRSTDAGGATLRKVDPSRVDLAKLRRLPTQGVKLGSSSKKSIETSNELTKEELTYIEEYADMLVDPIGIVDVTGSDNEAKYVFVWLQDLPKALENAYQRHGMQNKNYERVREEGRRARSSIKSRHNREIIYEYSVVFSGFAMEATMSQLESIAAIDGVFAITEVTYESMDYIPDPEYKALGNGVAREIMEIGSLHAAGIDGRGMKVGVIDSGIDATHPDLVGALKGGYNFAPRGTLNKGGRSSDMSTPDGNHGTHVSGIIASQGLFSLGIAPGVELYMAQVFTPDRTNSASTADISAALEAFSGGNPNPGTYPAVNLPKVDVVNMSLGDDYNSAYEAEHVVRNNAVIAGVMVVNSAGNNAYPDGNNTDRRNYSLGTGGVSLPISVAASQYGGNNIISYKPTVNGSASFEVYIENGDASLVNLFQDGKFGSTETRVVPFNYTSSSDVNYPYPGPTYTVPPLVYVENKGYEIYYACSNNIPTPGGTTGSDMTTIELQALNNMPAGVLAGKILVVNRGQNFLDYKGQALRLGAAGLVIINREEAVIGNLNIGSETLSADLVILSAPASVKKIIYDAVQSGQDAYLNPGLLNKLRQPAEPADFSSIGPVNETAEIKPDIMAPGYSVLSTDIGGYVEMGGTSMSSPFIAAVAALVKQVFPNAQPAEIKARIMNTADPSVIKPLSVRPNGNPNLYFNKSGTEISVYEQGAGFVNPKRAVSNAAYITVTSDKIPTGNSDKSTYEDAQMASFSFGDVYVNEEGPALSDILTATVHDGTVSAIRVAYNKDTRYSNKNLEDDVEVLYKISEDGKTFDVWLKVNEWASAGQETGNLYEGYIFATVDGKELVLPWATRVGGAPNIESDYWLLYLDRPIQVVRGTSSANQDYYPFSQQNTVYLMFDGTEIADSVPVRYTSSGSGSNRRYTAYLDVYFILWSGTSGRISHRLAILLDSGLTSNSYTLSDFIDTGDTYYLDWDGRANAASGNSFSSSLSNVGVGAYNIAFSFEDGYDWYDELGVVMTNTRPTITIEDKTLTANSYSYHDHLYAEDITVSGRLYSAATTLAANMGFYWAGEYLYSYDLIFELDQSLNALVDASTGYELEFYDEDYGDSFPWFCDADGYFSLTFPPNEDGYFFPEDICPSGVAYCTDGFDISNPWDDEYYYLPMLHGAMKSFQWCPQTISGPPITSIRINNLGTVPVSRGVTYDFDVILNAGANRNNVEWKINNPIYANVVKNADNSVKVTVSNKAGTAVLTVSDKIDGMSYSIILRIT